MPKLFVAGSLAGSDLNDARRLATACGGWAVVTSLPVAERGTGLLASSWGGHLVEQIVAFLRDCQRRPLATMPRARRDQNRTCTRDRFPLSLRAGEVQG